MKNVSLILFVFALLFSNLSGEGIPLSRLERGINEGKLQTARRLYNQGFIKAAVKEIENDLETDSSLIMEAAVIFGGNYHLQRLTDNIVTDRVGGFSPSGNKLVYAQDTFMVHYDDGLFDSYEDITSEIAWYDFQTGLETTAEIAADNPCLPRFLSDDSFCFIAQSPDGSDSQTSSIMYIYNLGDGTTTPAFPFRIQSYCVYNNGVVFYDFFEDELAMIDIHEKNRKVLYDNSSFLMVNRPLPLINNLSGGENIIMFQAGFEHSHNPTNIYYIHAEKGKPMLLTDSCQSFGSEKIFYPAAIDSENYAYLVERGGDVDVYCRTGGSDYRLTFDGGSKSYLAISADGLKIAYSYKLSKQGMETYEIFMLDFSRAATPDDLMYRFKYLR